MKRLDQRGVAALTVTIIVVISAGGTVGVPVAVDTADVDPDHPLYALERLGERIRMVSDVDFTKDRFGEYVSMCAKEKGLEYRAIMEEFHDKWQKLCTEKPVDDEVRKELVKWMVDAKHEIPEIHLEIVEEMIEEAKAKVPEELKALIEAKEERFKEIAEKLKAAENKEIEAALEELKEAIIEQIQRCAELQKYGPMVPDDVKKALEFCTHVDEIEDEVEVEVDIEVRGVVDVSAEFENRYSELEFEIDAIENEIRPEVLDKIKKLMSSAKGKGRKHGLIELEKLEELMIDAKELAAIGKEYKARYDEDYENISNLLKIIPLEKIPKEHKSKLDIQLAMAAAAAKEGRFDVAADICTEISVKIKSDFDEWIPGWRELIPKEFREFIPTKEEIEEWQEKLEEVGRLREEWALKQATYEKEYKDIHKTCVSGYSEKCKELILEAVKCLKEGADKERVEAMLVGKQGLVYPWAIPVSGKLVNGRLEVSGDIAGSDSFGVCEYTYSIEFSGSGEVSGEAISGLFDASMTSKVSVSAGGAEMKVNSPAEAKGSMKGTISYDSVDCDLSGKGLATSSGKVESDYGSVQWNCEIEFVVTGKLAGTVSDGTFEGFVYLGVSRVKVSELTAEISLATPTL